MTQEIERTFKALLSRKFTLGECLGWWGIMLTLLVLGAHFYRAGAYGVTMCVGGMLVFLWSTAAWKQYAVALFLLWGVMEWGAATWVLAATRMHFGAPWMRGAAILLGVSLLTALAAGHAWNRANSRAGDKPDQPALLQASVFMGIFLLLYLLHSQAPFPLLLGERIWPVLGVFQCFLAGWYGAVLARLLLDPACSVQIRKRAWAIFALVFYGQLVFGILGWGMLLMTGRLHVPVPAFILFAPAYRGSFSSMPLLVLVATLLVGTAWCSMLCYFGPLDSLAAGKGRLKPAPPFMVKALRYGRPLSLGGGLLAALGLRALGISLTAALSGAAAFTLVSLLSMALVSRTYGSMTHCTMFCPMGLVANLLGRLSPWRLRVDSQRCTHCGACEKVCIYRAITAESRSRQGALSRCTLCRDCISRCRAGAISVQSQIWTRYLNERVFVGVLVILHVLFLNVARV